MTLILLVTTTRKCPTEGKGGVYFLELLFKREKTFLEASGYFSTVLLARNVPHTIFNEFLVRGTALLSLA